MKVTLTLILVLFDFWRILRRRLLVKLFWFLLMSTLKKGGEWSALYLDRDVGLLCVSLFECAIFINVLKISHLTKYLILNTLYLMR